MQGKIHIPHTFLPNLNLTSLVQETFAQNTPEYSQTTGLKVKCSDDRLKTVHNSQLWYFQAENDNFGKKKPEDSWNMTANIHRYVLVAQTKIQAPSVSFQELFQKVKTEMLKSVYKKGFEITPEL